MVAVDLTIDAAFQVAPVDNRVFGAFVEHMGRCVYTGIYEPGHSTADQNGFRTDVLDLVHELGVTTVRYPGGNFCSAYRWEDSVGPVAERPRRLEPAWRSIETNEFGLDEFITWCRAASVEPMLALNLGTRGVAAAVELLEYANFPSGTALSDQRVANGAEQPHDIRMWCLGNELDGPWQTGHKTGAEYGRLATETARAMRQLQPDLELIAVGSSGTGMANFGQWQYDALLHCYELVDYLSLHVYYQETDEDLASFLASGVHLDRYITDMTAIADAAATRVKSPHRLQLALDEWNVWYQSRHHANEAERTEWQTAPRLAEDAYTAADAVVVGSLLISMLRHADRLTAASLAQLVNVIGAIHTEPDGPARRQTIFHPFALVSRWGRGIVLRTELTAPTIETKLYGDVPVADAVAVLHPDTGQTTVFLVNRSVDEPVTVTAQVAGVAAGHVIDAVVVHDADPHAINSDEDPDRVQPAPLDEVRLGDGRLRAQLPPVSWAMINIAPSDE